MRRVETPSFGFSSCQQVPPGDKAVVFSQWTKMLALVGAALDAEGIRYVDYDGSMSQAQRGDALDRFRRRPRIRVCLLSFHAGGVGLTLTEANHVFVLDSWWNYAMEDQVGDFFFVVVVATCVVGVGGSVEPKSVFSSVNQWRFIGGWDIALPQTSLVLRDGSISRRHRAPRKIVSSPLPTPPLLSLGIVGD